MDASDQCYISYWLSPLGAITLSSDGDCLTGLWFQGQAHFGSTLQGLIIQQDLPVFQEAVSWLESYFSGDFSPVAIPMRLIGTPFQQTVWNILCEIQPGQTISYGEIATRLKHIQGRPSSARAVGGAVARNPIAIMIPCHRVIGINGSLTGYAGGVERKAALLQLETRQKYRTEKKETGIQ